MMDKILLWIGQNFTSDVFRLSTMVQEILWSSAEFLLVFFCLRIANWVRIRRGKRRIVVRYMLFWCFVLINPYLLLTMPGATHDQVMLGNFTILIYTAISEGRDGIAILKGIVDA